MLKLLWRGVIITYRDVFSGFMLGMTALFILFKMSPNKEINAGLLAGLGIIAGLLKGLMKFITLEMVKKIPVDEYQENYPKYKMLLLTIILFVIGAFINYGFNFVAWFTQMGVMLAQSSFLTQVSQSVVTMGIILFFITGILSYFYEP